MENQTLIMNEVTVIEVIKAVDGKLQELKKALTEIAITSRESTGCLQYDLLELIEGSGEFLVLMRWNSLVDLRRHETSKYIEDFVRKYEGVIYGEVIQTEWKKFL